jgi:uncharacterized protein YutD
MKLSRPATAEELREARKAETKLAQMNFVEDIADFYDQETCEELRDEFAGRYERIVGVHPSHRAMLRGVLEGVRDRDGRQSTPVAEIIAQLRDRCQVSGLSSS